jgi:hypothetical protein
MREPSQPPQEPRQPDIQLTVEDRRALLLQLAELFNTEAEANRVLDNMEYPVRRRQPWTADADAMWGQIFRQLDGGIMTRGRYRLLNAVLGMYPDNEVFVALGARYGLLPPPPPPTPPAPPNPAPEEPDDACHVIVAAGTEEERAAVLAILRRANLDPAERWSTANAFSCRVATNDTARVRAALGDLPQDWILVPAGEPDYLLDLLFVQGPDGRMHRLRQAPAQQTVQDLGAAVVNAQYGEVPGRTRAFVVDRQQANGDNQRLAPDETLHDAGVRDGDTIRIGFEATAGTVGPLVYREALQRMRNQILDFAGHHDGITVSGQPPVLPTQYEIEFEQPGFAPPVEPGGEPVAIDRHRVLIQLYGDFPLTAPFVFWLTPVFHPNVFPNYDSEPYRSEPNRRGQVCLGALVLSYTPAMDFGELCQTLIDMAGYRNYTVFEEVEGPEPEQTGMLQLDFVDKHAAVWAWNHQKEIQEIGGLPVFRAPKSSTTSWNVIEAEDGE